MRIIAVLIALAIFGFTPAFAQSSEEAGLRFYPVFPTEKDFTLTEYALSRE